MNKRSTKQVQVRELGLIEYQAAWDEQERIFAGIIAQKVRNRDLPAEARRPTPNYLLFCEHPPVYTLGKSGKEANLLLDEPQLAAIGATFHRINRGGDITYHGPGQLVGYPILDLDNFFTDIHRYMRLLEEAVIRTLTDYGLDAGRIDGLTGVWLDYDTTAGPAPQTAESSDRGPRIVGPRKICAMGVKASRWVTMHGFALNVNTDLRYFNHIVPCGIDDKAVTSMQQELGQVVSLADVSTQLRRHLADLFGMQLVDESQSTVA